MRREKSAIKPPRRTIYGYRSRIDAIFLAIHIATYSVFVDTSWKK
jgi:hypothetical protein